MSGLILGGSYEARKLAEALAQHGHHKACLSLAGATKAPAAFALPKRIGGFGGAQGFAHYLHKHAVRWVVDATHPFALKMSQTAHRVCAQRACPYLRLERPPWQKKPSDHWQFIDDLSALGKIIAKNRVIFAATGRQSAPYYVALGQNTTYLRVIDLPIASPSAGNLHYVQARPPFSVKQELAQLKALKVDYLVAKNAGGAGGRSKLDAAAQLGLPIILLNRPILALAPKVETVRLALDWIIQHD